MDKVSKSAARFKQVRTALQLTQQQLADRLFLSRNYIAKIESGKKEPSVRALNALEALLVDKGNTGGLSPHVQSEDQAPYGDASMVRKSAGVAALKRKIQEQIDSLIAAADNDLQRLGWIAEQMHQHLEEPVHWGVHERVIKQVLEEQKKKDEKAAAEKAAQQSRREDAG